MLTETAIGYGVFKIKDRYLKDPSSLATDILNSKSGPDDLIKLKGFAKFDNTTEALENCLAIGEGKVTEKLSSLLSDNSSSSKLLVADPKLGSAINKLPGLKFDVTAESSAADIYRSIRENFENLVSGISADDLAKMALGLSHSVSRHKLKFSADKVDTMIVQAVGLLEDVDKEINMSCMRVKEWYGWHFPELAKIVSDNIAYAKLIKLVGMIENYRSTDLSDVLPEELEEAVKTASEISMGSAITEEDLKSILSLADEVITLSEYRTQLAEYLSNRMQAIAPNVTALLGDLVGAKLIAHAGNLLNLAKMPASTIQLLGAEKALFRALKAKHDTPKYGLLFHASLVGQAPMKFKGKIARVLGAKAALCLRVDALSENIKAEDGGDDEVMDEGDILLGVEMRAKVEQRLKALETHGTGAGRLANKPKTQNKLSVAPTEGYDKAADTVMEDAVPRQNGNVSIGLRLFILN